MTLATLILTSFELKSSFGVNFVSGVTTVAEEELEAFPV